MIKTLPITVTLLLFYLIANQSFALDVVKLQNQQQSKNKASHNIAVVKHALEITKPEYGDYELEVVNLTMSNGRLHKSAIQGKIFNAVIVLTNELWNNSTIGIKVPVRLGLLSYRILLVNKENVAEFKDIENLQDLNAFSAGLTRGWETEKIYAYHDLNRVVTGHFAGIFLMLDKQRFDYIPRGVYEVYDELSARATGLNNVVVEPTLLVKIPTTTYLYVSPTEPRIGKRLNDGLQKMLKNGDLERLLLQFYQADIRRAKLKSRKVIHIPNPYYKKEDMSQFQQYLY